jgi:hypothetical protein
MKIVAFLAIVAIATASTMTQFADFTAKHNKVYASSEVAKLPLSPSLSLYLSPSPPFSLLALPYYPSFLPPFFLPPINFLFFFTEFPLIHVFDLGVPDPLQDLRGEPQGY